MVYLLLTILSSFAVGVLSKINETAGINRTVVIASNYPVGAVFGLLVILLTGQPAPGVTTLWLGLVGGLLWPGGFFVFMWGVKQFGMALPGMVGRLSLAVPVLFGLLFLNEPVTAPLILGLILTAAALSLFGTLKRSTLPANLPLWQALVYFPVLVLVFGLVSVWVNVFNTFAPADEYWSFLTLVYASSAVVSWSIVVLQRQPVTADAVWRGLLLGVPNFGSSYFLLLALTAPAFANNSAIAYTLSSLSVAVLTFLSGILIWREPTSRRRWIGAGLALLAIVLLNLG